MPGQRVGYVRVSTSDQNADRQLQGIALDRVFSDAASGRDASRPQLDQLLAFVREGDIVVVHSMDRLARNLLDLRRLVETLTQKGVSVEFVKEAMTFTGKSDSPMSTLLLSMMGAFAEFERSLIRERQLEGIALAKAKGLYRGRKASLTQQQQSELVSRVMRNESKSALAREMGVSRETVYKYMRQAKAMVDSKTENN